MIVQGPLLSFLEPWCSKQAQNVFCPGTQLISQDITNLCYGIFLCNHEVSANGLCLSPSLKWGQWHEGTKKRLT